MKHLKRPILVAITGGIAAGKSVVSNWFEKKGYNVYYADKIGHHVLNREDIQKKVIKQFGKDLLIKREIDRKKLGEIIFRSAEKRKMLNEILHPEIRKSIQEIINNSSKEVLMFEIPLLFENNLHEAFDLTINISTQEDIKIARIMKRDKLTKQEVLRRIKSQMDDKERMQIADVNITNNDGLDDLYKQLEKVKIRISKLDKKNVKNIMNINLSEEV